MVDPFKDGRPSQAVTQRVKHVENLPDTPENRAWLLTQLVPRAINVRDEGECDSCYLPYLMSYQLPEFAKRRGEMEYCGYRCLACGWGGAGAREYKPSQGA